MKALILKQHSDINQLRFFIEEKLQPVMLENECLVKVEYSGINPSDALATTGYFKDAILPRTPGRDFAGTVIAGPANFLGKKVWGTGGAAGIESDGTQAEIIKLPVAALSEIPSNMNLLTASAQTLPYVTAYYSLVERARIKAGDTVLITGALGQVGQAALSICQWKKAIPIALVRGEEDVKKAEAMGIKAIDSDEKNLAQKILALNNEQPIQTIFNSLGNLYWHDFITCLSDFGKIVTIGARENNREAMLNLFELYRANQEIIGVNTVHFNFTENANFLNVMRDGFEKNLLKPLAVAEEIYTLENAEQAYQQVLAGSHLRVVIKIS